jgi:hypothetical protein
MKVTAAELIDYIRRYSQPDTPVALDGDDAEASGADAAGYVDLEAALNDIREEKSAK